jgi:N-acetylneuraminic acid mutarotase
MNILASIFLVSNSILLAFSKAQILTHPHPPNTTWIKGSSDIDQIAIYGSIGVESTDNTPGGRYQAVVWADSDGNPYVFGGLGYGTSFPSSENLLSDVWYLNSSSLTWKWVKGSSDINQDGVYGPIGIESIQNTPGGRRGAVVWADSDGNSYLFGGLGHESALSSWGAHDDVWFFNISNLCWTWMKGSSIINEIGNSGFIGV